MLKSIQVNDDETVSNQTSETKWCQIEGSDGKSTKIEICFHVTLLLQFCGQRVWFQPGYERQFGHPCGVQLMDKKTTKMIYFQVGLNKSAIFGVVETPAKNNDFVR